MTRPRHTKLAGRRAKELRSELTPAEKRLWHEIRGRKLGARFRRQVPIGVWIADFACFEPRIVIEVDDTSHDDTADDDRSSYIAKQGYRILRFTNKEASFELDYVVDAIRLAVEESL